MMARVKGVKRLKDEPGFNGAIGESMFNLVESCPCELTILERLRSEKVDERGVALIGMFSSGGYGVPNMRNRVEKDHQFEP